MNTLFPAAIKPQKKKNGYQGAQCTIVCFFGMAQVLEVNGIILYS